MEILDQYHDRAQVRRDTLTDFERVINLVSEAQLAAGITGMLRSSSTANFPQTMGWLFDASGPGLQTKLLQLFDAAIRSSPVCPDRTGKLSHDTFACGSGTIVEIAARAQSSDPGVVERVGDFFARNPAPLRSLGSAWVAVLLSHIPDTCEPA